MRRSGPAFRSFDDRATRSTEAWHIAAMIAVGVVTLIGVIALWLL